MSTNTFTVGLVSSYDGKIVTGTANYERLNWIKLFIPEVKLINLTIILNEEQFNCKNWQGNFYERRMDCKNLKCKILLTFEPSDEQVRQEHLHHTFSQMNLKSMEISRNDIMISVQGKEFGFNKKYLSNISSVFKEMFENCSENNEIDGKKPSQMKQLSKL